MSPRRTDRAAPGRSKGGPIRIEVQFLIPVADNEGNPFDADHDAVFGSYLVSLFGGYSVLLGGSLGEWEAEGGRIDRDTMRLYMVAVPGLVARG